MKSKSQDLAALEVEIETCCALSNWIGAEISERNSPSDDRSRMAAACFYIAIEHNISILFLCKSDRVSAAMALIRAVVDSYVRGMWIIHCADDTDVENIKNLDSIKGTINLMTDLENNKVFKKSSISEIGENIWGTVSDYTHTGFRMMVRHINKNDIGPSFAEDEIIELMRASSAWALMAAGGVALLAKDDAFADELIDKMKDFANN